MEPGYGAEPDAQPVGTEPDVSSLSELAELAKSAYWRVYCAKAVENGGVIPRDQRGVENAAWDEVVRVVRGAIDVEYAMRYLGRSESTETVSPVDPVVGD